MSIGIVRIVAVMTLLLISNAAAFDFPSLNLSDIDSSQWMNSSNRYSYLVNIGQKYVQKIIRQQFALLDDGEQDGNAVGDHVNAIIEAVPEDDWLKFQTIHNLTEQFFNVSYEYFDGGVKGLIQKERDTQDEEDAMVIKQLKDKINARANYLLSEYEKTAKNKDAPREGKWYTRKIYNKLIADENPEEREMKEEILEHILFGGSSNWHENYLYSDYPPKTDANNDERNATDDRRKPTEWTDDEVLGQEGEEDEWDNVKLMPWDGCHRLPDDDIEDNDNFWLETGAPNRYYCADGSDDDVDDDGDENDDETENDDELNMDEEDDLIRMADLEYEERKGGMRMQYASADPDDDDGVEYSFSYTPPY